MTLDITLPSSRFGPHEVVLEDPAGRSVTTAFVSVEMVDGRPEFTRLEFGGNSDPPPTVAPEALATVDWSRAAWDAVKIEAAAQVWTDDTLSVDEQVRRLQAVDRTAAEARRYNRLSADDLAEVLELWSAGGSQAVAARFCVSRRQADRYVRRARQEAGQP